MNPETYLPKAEASEARKEEYLNGNFDELLKTKCGLVWVKLLGAAVLGGPSTSMGFVSQNSSKFSPCKTKEDLLWL